MPDDDTLIPTQFKLARADKKLLSWIATEMGEEGNGTLPLAASEVVRRLIRQEAARREKKNLAKNTK